MSQGIRKLNVIYLMRDFFNGTTSTTQVYKVMLILRESLYENEELTMLICFQEALIYLTILMLGFSMKNFSYFYPSSISPR